MKLNVTQYFINGVEDPGMFRGDMLLEPGDIGTAINYLGEGKFGLQDCGCRNRQFDMPRIRKELHPKIEHIAAFSKIEIFQHSSGRLYYADGNQRSYAANLAKKSIYFGDVWVFTQEWLNSKGITLHKHVEDLDTQGIWKSGDKLRLASPDSIFPSVFGEQGFSEERMQEFYRNRRYSPNWRRIVQASLIASSCIENQKLVNSRTSFKRMIKELELWRTKEHKVVKELALAVSWWETFADMLDEKDQGNLFSVEGLTLAIILYKENWTMTRFQESSATFARALVKKKSLYNFSEKLQVHKTADAAEIALQALNSYRREYFFQIFGNTGR